MSSETRTENDDMTHTASLAATRRMPTTASLATKARERRQPRPAAGRGCGHRAPAWRPARRSCLLADGSHAGDSSTTVARGDCGGSRGFPPPRDRGRGTVEDEVPDGLSLVDHLACLIPILPGPFSRPAAMDLLILARSASMAASSSRVCLGGKTGVANAACTRKSKGPAPRNCMNDRPPYSTGRRTWYRPVSTTTHRRDTLTRTFGVIE